MIAATFATKGTQYVPLAQRCREYFRPWLDVRVVETQNKLNLAFNIFERTHAMLRIARENPTEPLCWLDADLVPLKCPDLILSWPEACSQYDIGLTCRPAAPRLAHRHCAGAVLWPPGGGKGLEWLSRTMENDPQPCEGCREQLYISRTIKEMGLRVLDLGNGYNDPLMADSTIIHHPDDATKPQHDILSPPNEMPPMYSVDDAGNWRLTSSA